MATGPLEGKVALVTGAGSTIGMGRVMSLAFVRAGARVTMMDVNEASLAQTANEAREIGGDDAVLTVTGDVSAWDDADSAVQQTVSQLGGLHILVNNAGVHPRLLVGGAEALKFWELPTDAWSRVITVNVSGPYMMARAAAPHLVEQGWGRIIGVTTSLDTMMRGMPYGPSKAAHEAMIASMARELDGTGVTVNALLPGGGTNTNFIERGPDRDLSALIQPEVMGPPAAWLASDASDGFTGMRVIAADWDESRSVDDNLAKASAPAGWSQLGRQSQRA